MKPKVYFPLVGGLGAAGIGAVRMLSDGVDLPGLLILGGGVGAIALALIYGRGPRAQGS